MALSRWSNSVHYIFEPCGSKWSIEVCGFGQFSVPQILRHYKEIETRAKVSGYSFRERLELRAYLASWALFKMGKINPKRFRILVEGLRLYGSIGIYSKDPWSPFFEHGLPKQLTPKPSFGRAIEAPRNRAGSKMKTEIK